MKANKLMIWIYIFIQFFTISTFCNINFNSQKTISSVAGTSPQIATNSSGQFVYAAWTEGASTPKLFRSSDFGEFFTDTAGSFGSGIPSQILTDDSGRYVFVAWVVSNAIKIFYSNDFGVTWAATTDTFGTVTSGLSLAIDSTGQHLYVGFIDGTNNVKIFYSNDFGVTFVDSAGVFGTTSSAPRISTNSSGKYVYGIWNELGIPPTNVKIFYSDDFGVTWAASTGVFGTASTISGNVTNDSGQYVYFTWKTGTAIKVFSSNDFGVNVSDTGVSFGNSLFKSFIDTNGTGQYVYLLREGNPDTTVSMFSSSDFGVSWSSFTVSGFTQVNDTTINGDKSGSTAVGVWRDSVATKPISIYYTTDFGVTWTAAGDVGGGVIPQIAISSSGEFVYIIVNNDNINRITLIKGVKSLFSSITQIGILRI